MSDGKSLVGYWSNTTGIYLGIYVKTNELIKYIHINVKAVHMEIESYKNKI